MQVNRLSVVVGMCVVGSVMMAACENKQEAAKPAPAATPAKTDAHGHEHAESDGHSHGATTQLGEQVAGAFSVKASRDGDVKAGSDVPIDAWVTSATAKLAAVRFWIGSEDAKGSVKAKASLEKDNWHTHVDAPSPMPEGSKLWIEVENDKGEKVVTGFDLKL